MCCRLTRQSQPVQQIRPEKQNFCKYLQFYSQFFYFGFIYSHLEVDIVAKDEPHAKHQLSGGNYVKNNALSAEVSTSHFFGQISDKILYVLVKTKQKEHINSVLNYLIIIW